MQDEQPRRLAQPLHAGESFGTPRHRGDRQPRQQHRQENGVAEEHVPPATDTGQPSLQQRRRMLQHEPWQQPQDERHGPSMLRPEGDGHHERRRQTQPGSQDKPEAADEAKLASEKLPESLRIRRQRRQPGEPCLSGGIGDDEPGDRDLRGEVVVAGSRYAQHGTDGEEVRRRLHLVGQRDRA